jgi:prepilin-type N-terminal cleavage/methylation domain-containing protein
MRKAFTLIELLVVIAIIGLIASIVLVNLQGVRGRGRVAAGKQFSSSLQSTLGSEAVGIWRLNEGSGTTVFDNAGYSNNGTLTGGPAWKTESECGLGLGSCLSFDGVDDYVAVNDNAILQVVNSITISAWVNPSSSQSNVFPRILDKERYLLHITQTAPFSIHFNANTLAGLRQTSASAALQANQWLHVAVTYDGTIGSIYVNGVRVQKTDFGSSSALGTNASPFRIGDGQTLGTRNWTGMIDDVSVYATTLTTAQVQHLYAQGRERHLSEQ